MERWLLLVAIVAAGFVAFVAFRLGDRRRRIESGAAGPRPAPSIGEAVRLAGPTGFALVLFLGEDETSMQAGQALASDPTVIKVLRREAFSHAVVKAAGDDLDIAEALYSKYTKEDLPREPVAVLLDGNGELAATAKLRERGPLADWLLLWVDRVPQSQPKTSAEPTEQP